MYTYNRGFENLVLVSVESLIQHYESPDDLQIWIFEANDSVSIVSDAISKLPELNGKPQISVSMWRHPDWTEEISNNVSNRFPSITLWRLGLPFTFTECDQILYLDADTLIYDDISKLFDLVDPNVPVAGVHDTFHYLNAAAGLNVENNENYVNSGVLVFNVQKYNECWSIDEFLKTVAEDDLGGFPDQDLVNKQFKNQIQQLPMAYNLQQNNAFLDGITNPPVKEHDRELLVEADKNVKIKHYLFPGKPNLSLISADHDKYREDWWATARLVQTLYGA
ncbi:glycosyltransferase [Furfurilactobacillus siliginis]|nr:glycosyltransferase [Furfurilactobacillus siliginis]